MRETETQKETETFLGEVKGPALVKASRCKKAHLKISEDCLVGSMRLQK